MGEGKLLDKGPEKLKDIKKGVDEIKNSLFEEYNSRYGLAGERPLGAEDLLIKESANSLSDASDKVADALEMLEECRDSQRG